MNDAAADTAFAIGNLEPTLKSDLGSVGGEIAYVVAHGALGCAASAAEGTGCAGGAIGGATSAALTPYIASTVAAGSTNISPEQAGVITALAALTGGVTAGLAGANAQAGATFAENEAQNNCLGHPETCLQLLEEAANQAAPRVAGVTQLVAGGAMTLTGASLTVAGGAACPETLGAGCGVAAGGVALTGIGLDNVSSGWQTLITGQYTPTVGAQLISQVLPVTPQAGEMFYGNVTGSFGTQLSAYGNFAVPPATNSSGYTYDAMNPGPLPDSVAGNFAGGRYSVGMIESSDQVLFKAGDASNPGGSYFSFEMPQSVAQVRIDNAVKPYWIDPTTGATTGSSPINSVITAQFPAGTTYYYGPVGSQGGVYLGGQKSIQIFIPNARSIGTFTPTGPLK